VVSLIGVVSSVVRMGKSVVPLVVPHIQAFACKSCSSLASVSFIDNKITVRKCRCV
jgi:hypothetical protein